MTPFEDRIGDDLLPAVSGRAWRLDDGGGAAKPVRLPAEFSTGDFLVGGLQCGAGTGSRAVAGLAAAGVVAIIGRSFDDSFFSLALDAGLPAAAIEEAPAIKSGDLLRVDVETFRIVNLSSGDRYVIRNLSDDMLVRLRRTARR